MPDIYTTQLWTTGDMYERTLLGVATDLESAKTHARCHAASVQDGRNAINWEMKQDDHTWIGSSHIDTYKIRKWHPVSS